MKATTTFTICLAQSVLMPDWCDAWEADDVCYCLAVATEFGDAKFQIAFGYVPLQSLSSRADRVIIYQVRIDMPIQNMCCSRGIWILRLAERRKGDVAREVGGVAKNITIAKLLNY